MSKKSNSEKKEEEPSYAEDIKGYKEIPRSEYGNIQIGDRICYLRSDNDKFSRGGFVQAITSLKDDENKKLFVLSFDLGGNYKRFSILWDNIEKLWKKKDADYDHILGILNDLVEYLYKVHGKEFRDFMRERAKKRQRSSY